MRAIDTNVLARYLIGDDPDQSSVAAMVIAEGVFVPITVLLELGWLLMSRYRQSRPMVVAAMTDVIDLPSVSVADVVSMRWAIARFEAGADIADMIHIVCAASAISFATFDRAIQIDAGPQAPVAVETLA